MACPFFRPSRLMEWGSGPGTFGRVVRRVVRNPGRFGGAEALQLRVTHGDCARHFPQESAADAVRFSVSGVADGVVQVVWILEQGHAPLEHGLLEYREDSREFIEPLSGVIGLQARVFAENYLGRRLEVTICDLQIENYSGQRILE